MINQALLDSFKKEVLDHFNAQRKSNPNVDFNAAKQYGLKEQALTQRLDRLSTNLDELCNAFLTQHIWLKKDAEKNGKGSFLYGFIKHIFQDEAVKHFISDPYIATLISNYPTQHLRSHSQEHCNINSIFSRLHPMSRPISDDWQVEALDVARFEAKHPRWQVINESLNEKPMWCAYDKKENNYYVPKGMFPHNIRLNAQVIEVEGQFGAPMAWHATLFARICPAIEQGVDYQQYRRIAPPSLLIAAMIESFCCDSWSQENIKPLIKQSYLKSLGLLQDTGWFHASPSHHEMADAEQALTWMNDGTLVEATNNLIIKVPDNMNNVNLLVYPFLWNNGLATLTIQTNRPTLKFANSVWDETLHLQRIEMPDKADLKKSMHYAVASVARNRLLMEDNVLLNKKFKQTHELWQAVGGSMLNRFKKDGHSFIELISKNEKINAVSHQDMAELGERGITYFFEELQHRYVNPWVAYDDAPAPKLSCVFDVTGGGYAEPLLVVEEITRQIKQFGSRKSKNWGFSRSEVTSCSPLFSELGLQVMPNINGIEKPLIDCIEALNDRKSRYPDETRSLILNGMEASHPDTKTFVNTLLNRVKQKPPMLMLVRIPCLEAPLDPNNPLQARYFEVLNIIENNVRTRNQPLLLKNVAPLQDVELKKIEFLPKGDDVLYPLSSGALKVQQQQQQQQQEQQEQQQEQQEQQEQEQEQEQSNDVVHRVIRPYEGGNDLITRKTIAARYQEAWNKLPAEVKQRSCASNVTDLFSCWVGSAYEGDGIISQIEPAAVEKLLEFLPQTQFGLDPNRTAGFYLASSSRGLILCFNEIQETRDVKAYQAQDKKDRDPFFVHLKTPPAPQVFYGDARQCELSNMSALEEKPMMPAFINAVASASANFVNQFAALSSWFGGSTSQQNAPVKINNDKEQAMASWATIHSGEISEQSRLFDKLATYLPNLSQHEIHAFSQVFQVYDSRSEDLTKGTDEFLKLVSIMHGNCRPEHFTIWRESVLGTNPNWSTLLECEEVASVVESVRWLNDHKPTYATLWWSMVKAQAEASGSLSYADLWSSFERVMQWVDEQGLNVDADKFAQCMTTHPMNTKQLFSRLFSTLKEATQQPLAKKIQQDILDNMNDINWRHDGFYYASCYAHYPFWDESLNLEGNVNDYKPRWDVEPSNLTGNELKTKALRFACQRMHVEKETFDEFKNLPWDQMSEPVARYVMASCALGLDKPGSLNHDTLISLSKDKNVSNVLNKFVTAIKLDGPLTPLTLTLTVDDLQSFCSEISKRKLDDLNELHCSLEFLNNSAASLRYLESARATAAERNEAFNQCITFAMYGADDKLRNSFPWLIWDDDKNSNPYQAARTSAPVFFLRGDSRKKREESCKLFDQKMRSIVFEKTQCSSLPTVAQLQNYYRRILEASDSKSAREAIVAQLRTQGIVFSGQDVDFQPLLPAAKEALLDIKLQPLFKPDNQQLLEQLRPYLATPSSFAAEDVERFKKLLIDLDRKNNFNELGQVLGVLVSTAKNNHSIYSMGQLTQWISALMDREALKNGEPFPLDCLTMVLACNGGDSNLLNGDLTSLRGEPDSKDLIDTIMKFMASKKLNQALKTKLTGLALRFKDLPERLEQLDADVFKRLENTHASQAVLSMWLDVLAQEWTVEKDEAPESMTWHIEHKIDKEYQSAWDEYQLQRMQAQLNHEIEPKIMYELMQCQPEVQMVLWAAITASAAADVVQNFTTLKDKLQASHVSWFALINYYKTPPRPNIVQLIQCLPEYMNGGLMAEIIGPNIKKFEYEFEANIHAKNKRHFSSNPSDANAILHVLADLKLKGEGYIDDDSQKKMAQLFFYLDTFSQEQQLASKDTAKLQRNLHEKMHLFRHEVPNSQYAAEALAIMREILLRKTGKWMNQTQTMVLLFAALHHNESMLQQIHTGEGKSIITAMRVAFRALSGQIVDVCSSKDSLASRDHDEFTSLFDAMGIRHAQISSSSNPGEYYAQCEQEVGAIHYSTLNQLGLWFEGLTWEGKLPFSRYSDNRVIYLDEADAVIMDQRAVLNLAPQALSDYNLDAWVYREVFNFYKTNIKANEDGQYVVSQQQHLDRVLEQIIVAKHEHKNHPDSPFLNQYLTKDLTQEQVKELNSELLRMLSAAHHASQLKVNKDFCVVHENKTLNGQTRQVRTAKVLLNQQIAQGSSYSDLVHQFLHLRLNEDAVHVGQAPNYVIDPESHIALSLQPQVLLQEFYSHREGCTGTGGNKADMAHLTALGFNSVLKVPTHHESQTDYLAPIYVSHTSEHVNRIVENITSNGSRPVLVICDSDAEVLRISQEIQAKLQEPYKVLVDTNAGVTPEATILKQAAMDYCVTVSARISRGSDISLQNELGLHVICTSALQVRAHKQAEGRTGRYGAKGSCVSVIDVEVQNKRWNLLLNNELAPRMDAIYRTEKEHLSEKIKKHMARKDAREKHKKRWVEMNTNETMQENYLRSRTLRLLDTQWQQEQNQWSDRKDKLITAMSLKVMDAVREVSHPDRLKKEFETCRARIERIWEDRLAGKLKDDEATYRDFLDKATVLWNKLCDNPENKLTQDLIQSAPLRDQESAPYWEATTAITERKQHDDMNDLATFYCFWAYNKPEQGHSDESLFAFYSAIHGAVETLSAEDNRLLLQCLMANVANKNIYTMRYSDLKQVLSVYSIPNSMIYLNALSKCFKQKNQPRAIEAFVKMMPVLIKHQVSEKQACVCVERILTVLNSDTTISSQALENLSRLLDDKKLAHSFAENVDEVQWHQFMNLFDQRVPSLMNNSQFFSEVQQALNDETDATPFSRMPDRLKKTPMYLYLAQLCFRDPRVIAPDLGSFEACLVEPDDYELESQWMRYLMGCGEINKVVYDDFIQHFSRCETPIKVNCLNHLATYPPFIPMGYVKDVIFKDGVYDEEQARLLGADAKQYHQFLLKQKIVEEAKPVDRIKENAKLAQWNEYFTKMPVAMRSYFFAQVNAHPELSPDSLSALAEFALRVGSTDELGSAISLYDAANKRFTQELNHSLVQLIDRRLPCAQSVDLSNLEALFVFLKINPEKPNPAIAVDLMIDDGRRWVTRLWFTQHIGITGSGNPIAACMRLLFQKPGSLLVDPSKEDALLVEGFHAYVDYMDRGTDEFNKSLDDLHRILVKVTWYDVIALSRKKGPETNSTRVLQNMLNALDDRYPKTNRPPAIDTLYARISDYKHKLILNSVGNRFKTILQAKKAANDKNKLDESGGPVKK